MDWSQWGQKITVVYEYGKVKVKSVSLGNEIWDLGRNSKRVKLFIYAFNQTVKEFDKDALLELEREVERANNWDDYKIPESLPQPEESKRTQFWLPVIGGLIASVLISGIVAFLSVKGIYIIGLFEVGVAFLLGIVLKHLIKSSDYTNYNKLHYLLIVMILIVYIFNQYFQYQIILNGNNYEPIGFIEFIKLRLEAGLTVRSLNTGWIGLVISWILQLGLTYIMGIFRLSINLTKYQLNKIPMEVVDFASYHFIKEKSEDQVRAELSKMGWTKKSDQDDVFKSIGAMQSATELNRV